MRSLRVVHLLAVLLVLAAGGVRVTQADDLDIGREEQMKAAYLFNFAKFIDWPANAKGPIRVCFIGAQGVHASLTASVAGKTIGARVIATAVLEVTDSRLGCDVIYLDASVDANALMRGAQGNTALTVSDADEFTQHGGIIRLFKHENRLRFDINLDNARRAGLKISSNLLKLASRVEQERTP
jgi:hypothetical protein